MTQPYADLRERLLRISDNICDAIAEHREPVVTLADANELDRAATLLDRCIALEGALEPFAVIAEVIDGADAEEAVAVHTLKFPLREQGLTVGDFQRARTTLSGTSK